MRYLIISYLCLVILSCTLTEQSTLIIKNNSEYTIDVTLNNGNKKNINISKNKGEIVLANPGEVKINIKIAELRYENNYSVNLSYQEKKKFVFSISE